LAAQYKLHKGAQKGKKKRQRFVCFGVSFFVVVVSFVFVCFVLFVISFSDFLF